MVSTSYMPGTAPGVSDRNYRLLPQEDHWLVETIIQDARESWSVGFPVLPQTVKEEKDKVFHYLSDINIFFLLL